MYNQTHSEISKMNTHFSPAFENLRFQNVGRLLHIFRKFLPYFLSNKSFFSVPKEDVLACGKMIPLLVRRLYGNSLSTKIFFMKLGFRPLIDL